MRQDRTFATSPHTELSKQGLVSYEHVNIISSAAWERLC